MCEKEIEREGRSDRERGREAGVGWVGGGREGESCAVRTSPRRNKILITASGVGVEEGPMERVYSLRL